MFEKAVRDAEAKAELARRKYSQMTVSEILAGIISRLLLTFIVIILVCIYLFYSPLPDRVLSIILLAFVLMEMAVEYALWFFTYRLGRKTEAPLADLQKFSVLTKEGWKRAEIILDLTTPFFRWLEGLRARVWPDWREAKEEAKTVGTAGTDMKGLVDAMRSIAKSLETLDARLLALERAKGTNTYSANRNRHDE